MEETHAESTSTRMRNLPSWLLTQSAARASRLVAAGFADVGARGYHYRILAALDEFGVMSQAELGRRCGIDRSDVVAMINELVARGFVARVLDPEDRRRNIISITPSGGEQLRLLDDVLAGIENQIFAPLSTDERAQLAGLLVRLREHQAAG